MRNRFAPSPTGALHLGNARTALLAWLQTRQAGGSFVLRIEDLDTGRVRSGAEETMLKDLTWLGLDWDEGPDVGGTFGPYRQSERTEIYENFLTELPYYVCTCTRKEILESASAPHGLPASAPHGQQISSGDLRYPGTCSQKNIAPNISQPRALRLRLPDTQTCFDDAIHGQVCANVYQEIGDVVVRRNDGAFAYQFACALDDAIMQMTHVTRGDDLLSSTPRQILLAQMLGLGSPTYCHVPLMLDYLGQKISKRSGNMAAPSLQSLRETGINPNVVVQQLAQSLGWNLAAPCAAKDLIGFFNPALFNATIPGPVLKPHHDQ